MPEITVNSDKKIYADTGENLLDALRRHGVYADAPCGGKGICGKCRCKISGKDALLCRTVITGDMEVEIPDGMLYADDIGMPDTDYGAVIDIGSTTVKIIFFDIENGKRIYECSHINMQRSFGADVRSRVEYAAANGADRLFDVTRSQIDGIITELFAKNNISISRLRKIVISGNTVMEHIFCRENISGFASYPFTPVFLKSRALSAGSLGYSFDAEITVMPCASAFIGGDAVGGFMNCFRKEENAAFIDIGTNAEMAVFADGKIYTASAAAGPAFEGGKIKCGTGCVDGAVNHVNFTDGLVSVSTINRQPAAGICGSGLVDITAELLRCSVIDKSGRFSADSAYKRRMNDSGFNIIRNIYVTQNDIREIQLAKSAIYSGLSALMNDTGIKAEVLYLGGGIGEYINTENAVRIGLLPDIEIRRMGNTSAAGAEAVLLGGMLRHAEETAEKCVEIQLAGSGYFNDNFINNMDF